MALLSNERYRQKLFDISFNFRVSDYFLALADDVILYAKNARKDTTLTMFPTKIQPVFFQ